MTTETVYHPKSSSKIPPFDERNFSMWKTKAFYVLEAMDENMLDIVNDGPHQPMYQPMKDRVPDGPKKPATKDLWTSQDKHLVSLDVKARSAISNALPYHTFHLVQNCESSKEMMDTLTVTFEGNEEVKAATLRGLVRQYEHFFAKKDETLTQTFNRFNCLINDLRRYEEKTKHSYVLVTKFLDSLGSQWDHYTDVLKNSEKIQKMDLQSLYGNLRYHEESKLQRKELMKETHREKSIALYTNRAPVTDSDSDNSNSADSEEDKEAVLASAALIVRRYGGKHGKPFNGPRKSDSRTSSSSFRRSDTDRKPSEKKNDGKCFNCGNSDHFARDCPTKKDDSEESYKIKYEKLVAKLQKQKMEAKVLVAEQEKWVTDEESSEDEKVTCLMARIQDDTDDQSSSDSTFDADMKKAIRDAKFNDVDSSVYQVDNFKTYSINEKVAMFEYVCVQLSKSCELNGELKAKIQTLKDDIFKQNSALSELNEKYRDTCITNDSLYSERDQALTRSIKFQNITETWLQSHQNLNHLISIQIPDQCEKVLGLDTKCSEKVLSDTDENEFLSPSELVEDFKTRFISHSFLNQELINKHCVTNSEGVTTCKSKLTGYDPSVHPPCHEYSEPTTEVLLAFPISNGEFHSVHEQLNIFPECSVTESETSSPAESDSDSETSHPSPKCSIDTPSGSRTQDRVYQTVKTPESKTSPKHFKRNQGTRICYRCGDSKHKISACPFDSNTKRADNIKLRFHLNCLPDDPFNMGQRVFN